MKKILCNSKSVGGVVPVLWVLLIACFSLGADFLSVYPTNVYKGLDVSLVKEITPPLPSNIDGTEQSVESRAAKKNSMQDVVNNKWRAYLAITRST
jgi:hypothetical protein